MRTASTSLLAVALLLAGAQTMHGQYYITELGTGASSYAAGINNNGQVIGTDESGALDQAVIWQANTKPVYITSPSHDSGTGMAIADSGAVVGYFTTTSGTNLPFLYSGGTVTKLPLANAMPYAVNSSNQVVGADATTQQAFIYQGGTVSYIQDSSGMPITQATAYGINASGAVVGYSGINGAFVYNSAGVQYLADSPDGPAQAINANGLVAVNSAGNGPYLYDSVSQAETWLQDDCTIEALNSAGTVVGQNFGQYAVIYEGGNEYDLNTMINQNLGWTLLDACGINDKGQICGTGIDPVGNQNAFLLTPALAGDALLNGKVDINDLTIVLANYGQSVGMSWSTGDFNGDGTVDINDLTILLSNFNKSAAAAGIEAVPEPSTVALIGAGAIGLLGLVGWPRKRAS